MVVTFRPPHCEQRSRRPMSGTGISSGKRANPDGTLAMVDDPLDLDDLLASDGPKTRAG
jgi:hypothetical protein